MKRIFSILFVLVLAVSLMLVPAALVGASPDAGLVGLWHLDGNANDSSGNDNHGTVYGATYVSGKFGQALSFDGVDDYVQAGRTGMDKTQGTFELWVKPLDLDLKPQAFMVVNTTAGIPHNYQIQYWTDGKLYFRANKAGQEVSVLASSVGFTQDNWHHLAMTWDSSGVVAYVDGNSVGSYTGTMTFTNDLVGDLFVGAWFDTGRNSKAVIDEVRIWDEAVSPGTVPLYAGQTIPVGTVSVGNDGNNLYVKYQTEGDWCLTETHLHVATSLDDIPQKNGNPPPGQFDYKAEHDCATAYTYTIPLDEGWVPCETDLVIAAHAEVQKLGDVMTASLVSGADTDNVLVISENTTDPGYPLGYPGPYSDTPTSSVVIQDTEAAYSGWPTTITGAQWISDSTANPGIVNSWRLFTRNFSIPSNATNISGTLHIDSDNAEKAKINGSPADGLVYGEVYGAFSDDGEWKLVQYWPVSSYLQPGPNTLEVMVRNYYWVPTEGMWNYTGLIYKMDYEYQLLTTETAWGDGEDFPGKNWATYFEYHVQ